MIVLNTGVYYRLYGEETYVINANCHKKYLFNETVFDILQNLKVESTFERLTESIIQQYETSDNNQLRTDIAEFVRYLEAEDIISSFPREKSLQDSQDRTKIPAPRSLPPSSDEFHQRDLEELINSRCALLNQLEHVYLETTYRCNVNCIHCYTTKAIKKASQELLLEEIIGVIDTIRRMGVMQITFTGGEVFVRDDFMSMCRHAIRLGMAVNIYSNGLLLTNDNIAELCELKIYSYSSSLYGGDGQTHDNVTNLPGSFDRTLETLRRFKTGGVKTVVKTVVMKQNAHSFEALLRLVKRLELELETSLQVVSSDVSDTRPRKLRIGDANVYLSLMRMEYEILEKQLPQAQLTCRDRTSVCGVGRNITIDPYGNILPCNMLLEPVGNVRKDNIEAIWRNSEQLHRLRSLSILDLDIKCHDCPEFEFCILCPGAAMRENNSIAKHCVESCLLAKAKHNLCNQS